MSALGACGNADELRAAQAKIETLQKENANLRSNLNEATDKVARVSGEREDLRGQLEKATAPPPAAPPPAATKTAAAKPAKKGKHK